MTQPGVSDEGTEKAQLQTLAETKTTYAPHIETSEGFIRQLVDKICSSKRKQKSKYSIIAISVKKFQDESHNKKSGFASRIFYLYTIFKAII